MQTSPILDRIPLGIIVFNKLNQIISINHKGRLYFDKTNNFLLDIITDLVVKTFDRDSSLEKIIKYSNSTNLFVWEINTELIDYSSPQVLVIIRDETVNSRLEQTILKAEKLAVAGQLALGSLLEIRNPLTSARGFCQLIEQSEIHKEYIGIISKELDQIQLIVNNCSSLVKTSPANNLEFFYKKFLTCFNNQNHCYKLLMVRDAFDNVVINATEEHINILINSLINLINSWVDENVYIIMSSELVEKASYLNLNIRAHNDINQVINRPNNIENTIKCLECKNNQIDFQVINDNTLALNLQLPVRLPRYQN